MPTFDELRMEHLELLKGGRWHPQSCVARDRVAIIIPYRDRDEHLRIFLAHIHPFLQKQLIDYTIFIVEQVSKHKILQKCVSHRFVGDTS